jgi:hypothetical protein
MRRSKFPTGWDEERVRGIITHYEEQTEEEAVAADEAAFELNLKRDYFDSMRKDSQDHYRQLERLRQEFVETFTIAKIGDMDKDDYVEGRIVDGEIDRNSFCYWVEWKTRALGGMRGGTALKFGLYVDRKSQEYKFLKRFQNEDQAMSCIRKEIIRLIELAGSKDLEGIRKINLSPMFKGKILFLYFPKDFINILSEEHVDYFLKRIGAYEESKNLYLIYKRDFLVDWKNSDPVMKEWNMLEFSDFLHTGLGEPSKAIKIGIDLPGNLLGERAWRFLRPRPDKAALHELVGTLTHKEAEEMQELIDEEFEKIEGE